MKPAGIRFLAAAAVFLLPLQALATSFQGLTTTYTSPFTPYSAAFADFNSDGFLDMAQLISDGSSHYVRIMTGNGTGGFNTTTTDLATPSAPKAIVAADLNGDGKIDIAVVNTSNNNVSIFLNNGSGAFPTRVDIPAGLAPTAIALGDFRGDGTRDDLAVMNSTGNSVTILLNDGTGTFTATSSASWPASPDNLAGIAVGDFNGDNIEDIAVTRSSAGVLSIFKGNGVGTFQTGVDVTVGTGPKAVVAGDFNNDGITDLVVLNSSNATISVVKGDRSGTFTAEPAVSITNPADGTANPVDMAAADLNRDGIPDLAVVSNTNGNIPVLTGNGNATFTPATATETFTTGASPSAVAAGDLDGNGNGLFSLSSTNNSYSLQNNGSPALAGITVTPPGYNFGNFWIGNGHSIFSAIPVTISNPGSAPLTVSSMTLTGTNAGDYVLVPQSGTCGNLTPTIPAGSSCTVEVRFLPTSPGPKIANYNITSNATVSPALILPLTGTGINTSPSIYLTFTGIGSGTVSFSNGDPSCTTNCARIPSSAPVDLIPAPDSGMFFYGWSGCDTIAAGTCKVYLERDKRVTANFGQYARPVKLVTGYQQYASTVAGAYASASTLSTDEIRIHGIYMNENLVLNRNVSVTISGGWDSSFTVQGAPTTLHSIVVASGSAVLGNIILQ